MEEERGEIWGIRRVRFKEINGGGGFSLGLLSAEVSVRGERERERVGKVLQCFQQASYISNKGQLGCLWRGQEGKEEVAGGQR